MGKREVAKNVDCINVSDDLMNEMVREKRIQKLEEVFEKLYLDIEKELKKGEEEENWIRIGNRALYYLPEDSILIPDVERWKLPCNAFCEKMDGFSGIDMPYEVAKKYFFDKKEQNPMLENGSITYTDQNNVVRRVERIYIFKQSKISFL